MRLLLVSNGHGEDLSGAQLGAALQARGAEVLALPLVGDGGAYRQAGLAIAGRTRSYSTGGLGYASFAGRMAEIVQGQVLYLLRRSWRLWREAHQADGLVVVGDVIPVLLAWLTGKPVVTYLVAYSSHYEGRLRLPWPCGPCLASRRFRAVFSRDALTASDLSQQLGRMVQFLGNPFMEGIGAATTSPQRRSVLLLPGSRLPEAQLNFERMLALLEQLPATQQQASFEAALVRDLSSAAIEALARQRGWQLTAEASHSDQLVLEHQGLRLRCCWGQFQTLLPQAKMVISMAGTASEQAAGLGIPVLQLAGHGPQFTAGFAEAQRRLLGPAIHCAPGAVDDPATLQASARLLKKLLALPSTELERYRTEGLQRLGTSGGTSRMARAILDAVMPG
jgi:uncharacterized protein (TIGR03492 family)